MEKILIKNYKSPMGQLVLGSYQNQLCLCDWKYRKMRQAVDDRIKNGLKAEFEDGEAEVLDNAIHQLKEFFDRNRETFDIPFLLIGTPFQKTVWATLQDIPFGKTASYLDLSRNLGNPDAIRAVASANGANALSILIPCHRIIGSDGSLVGYAGGLDAKKKLLMLEGVQVPSAKNQIPLF
jgi:methylated-DNA-[protein]-cysteine S-methyltransferase